MGTEKLTGWEVKNVGNLGTFDDKLKHSWKPEERKNTDAKTAISALTSYRQGKLTFWSLICSMWGLVASLLA